ncbi:hypothetical protein AUC68_00420 [Methyloceanibacter methanicus]|uniref:Peptidase n=1 Tax=Methyloceanibacter methanicus TaxID=1774968 RepID=A0A1E3W6G5_9HYPH|nr:hypothetical protein AUC68_00420 [Methyloceanibacter methanicus]
MIRSFRHKGLRAFWEKGETQKLPAERVGRIERMLDRLNSATEPGDMDVPSYRFHRLKGTRTGTYAVTVSGNWRLTFQWEDGDATNVNFEDYH